jgi:hypothetical protein
MFKGLRCQSAISRGFDGKGVFQKVSKSDATGGTTNQMNMKERIQGCGWPFVGPVRIINHGRL